MSDILFNTNGGKSKHDYLFMYGGCAKGDGPSAVRFGVYKAYVSFEYTSPLSLVPAGCYKQQHLAEACIS